MSLRRHFRILRLAANYDIGRPTRASTAKVTHVGGGEYTVTLSDPEGACTFGEPRDIRELIDGH